MTTLHWTSPHKLGGDAWAAKDTIISDLRVARQPLTNANIAEACRSAIAHFTDPVRAYTETSMRWRKAYTDVLIAMGEAP